MKIAYLLLSADPIHIGHLCLASKVLNEDLVDKVYVVPTVQNPWKDTPTATFEQRCLMIQNAIANIDNCELEDIEKDLFPPYYSCNTLEALFNKYGKDTNEHFILGGVDTVDSLSGWMNYETMIKGRFSVIAFTREGKAPETKEIPYVLVESDIPDLSSTYIRNLIADRKNPYPYIPSENLELCKMIYSEREYEFYI